MSAYSSHGRICYIVYVFFQAEDGIRDLVRSRGLGDVYKRQVPFYQVVYQDKNPKGGKKEISDHLPLWAEFKINELTQQLDPVSYTHLTLPTSDLV